MIKNRKQKLKEYKGKQKRISERGVQRKENPVAILEEVLVLKSKYSEEEQIFFETGYIFGGRPTKKPERPTKKDEKEHRDYWIKHYARNENRR